MAITSSNPSSSASLMGGYRIASLIADYAGEQSSVLSEMFEENLMRSSPGRFVDWLLTEKVIDFRPPFSDRAAMTLFAKHIYPLLLESASMPDERAHLYRIAKKAQFLGHFIRIIPKFGKTSSPDGGSFATRAHQGVPISFYCDDLMGKEVTESDLMALRAKVDSYLVELLMDNKSIERMLSRSGQWHIGTTSLRSSLIHELTHVDDFLSGVFSNNNTFSYRWTNEEEERTIARENMFAVTRGEMQRVSHNLPSLASTYKEQPIMMRLFDAWMLGTDGTVRELCERSYTLPEGHPDRIDFNAKNLKLCAMGYLASFPSREQLLSDIDRGYWEEIVVHKNRALQFFVTDLLKLQGVEVAQAFLTTILETAPELGRDDVIPFIEDLWQEVFSCRQDQFGV